MQKISGVKFYNTSFLSSYNYLNKNVSKVHNLSNPKIYLSGLNRDLYFSGKRKKTSKVSKDTKNTNAKFTAFEERRKILENDEFIQSIVKSKKLNISWFMDFANLEPDKFEQLYGLLQDESIRLLIQNKCIYNKQLERYAQLDKDNYVQFCEFLKNDIIKTIINNNSNCAVALEYFAEFDEVKSNRLKQLLQNNQIKTLSENNALSLSDLTAFVVQHRSNYKQLKYLLSDDNIKKLIEDNKINGEVLSEYERLNEQGFRQLIDLFNNDDIKEMLKANLINYSELTSLANIGEMEYIQLIQLLKNKCLKKLFEEKFISCEKLSTIMANQVKFNELNSFLQNDNTFNLIDRLNVQKQKMYNNPERYVNDEYDNLRFPRGVINNSFKDNCLQLLHLSKIYDDEMLDSFFRMRLYKVYEYLKIFAGFNDDEKQLYKNLINCFDNNNKPFAPTQKIKFIDLINIYKKCGLDFSKMKEMTLGNRVDIIQLNYDLLIQVMKKLGFKQVDIDNVLLEKTCAWNLNYMHLLVEEINEDNNSLFKSIIQAANSNNFQSFIHDKSNIYGKINQNTEIRFNYMGVDYEKWIHPKKRNNVQFLFNDENFIQISQIASQIQEDMNSLMKTPARGLIIKQFPKFVKNNQFIIPDNYINKIELTNLIRLLSDTSEQGQLFQLWKRAENNLKSPDTIKVNSARNTLTILDHLNQRLVDISKINKTQKTKRYDLTIKMWDRLPQKDFFQGNYSTCCIGMGNENGSMMPHYLVNTAFNMIELVDNKSGETVGNALCYFAKNSKNELIFIIDNIEINNSAKPSDKIGVKLRDFIVQYAKNIIMEATNRDDIPIYIGNSYNDVPIDNLPIQKETVSFLGDVDCDDIYLDLYNGWIEKEKLTKECELVKLA